MKDSEIICRLIYCAWIGPFPEQKDLDGFRSVLDCFARAVAREAAEDDELTIKITPKGVQEWFARQIRDAEGGEDLGTQKVSTGA